MKKDLLKIINHYGVIPQLKYFQSEVFELNEAILECEYFKEYCPAEATFISINENDSISIFEYEYDLNRHIAEEIADVCVMLREFMEHYNISQDEVTEIMEYKIKRQIERIENESN